MILESVENSPLIWPSIEENKVARPKKYYELSATEAIQADCDVKAINIILQGLPPEIYALVSNHKVAKELWEIIQLLMQGTLLTKQERECKLYDEFDKFVYKKGETLHDLYLRFSLLLNGMNIYNMKLEQFQVNTKFLNTLPPEWSKFMTGVKLVWDLHTTNIDQIHAYLGQHEFHANEQGDDPIDAINHMMSFKSDVVTSRYLTTNNQLRNSSNPRKQATINDDRITLQPVQGRQISFASDPGIAKGQATQTVITHNATYYADDLDVYNSDCNKLNTAKVALMANLSHYGLDALAEVQNLNNVDTNLINQVVQVMPSSEQSNVVNHSETEITNDSNIIPYSWYVIESQQEAVLNSNSSTQQDALILFVIAQLKTQVVKCTDLITLDLLTGSVDLDFLGCDPLAPAGGFTPVDDDASLLEPRDNSVLNKSAPSCDHYFKLNEVKAQSQEKDTIISKLKERIKSLSGYMKEDKIKKELEEIETINIELDHRVSKLIAENEHLKQTNKQLYDSIKSAWANGSTSTLRVYGVIECEVTTSSAKAFPLSFLKASLRA
nr:hypothetical protein [Tanacetum cinerariifolium]